MDHLIQKCPSKPQCHLLDGAKYGLALFDPGIFRVWRRSVGEAKGEGQTQQTFTEMDGRTDGRKEEPGGGLLEEGKSAKLRNLQQP